MRGTKSEGDKDVQPTRHLFTTPAKVQLILLLLLFVGKKTALFMPK